MQKFRPFWLSEISVFGLKLAIFGSRKPIETKNGLGITKIFSECFGTPLVRAEKFSATPPQKGRFWGCRNFCKNAYLGRILVFFDSSGPTQSQNGLGSIKNRPRGLWNLFAVHRKYFNALPQKHRFRGCRNFYSTHFDQFWSKKVFLAHFLS